MEFVMALPVLLLLFALILSVGVYFLGSLTATITARRTAFENRPRYQSRQPLAFNRQTSRQDVVTESTTETPDYPTSKINFGPVVVKQSVLGGAWDHRELLRGNGPHWKDMARASIGGATNQIASVLDLFTRGFNPGSLKSLSEVGSGVFNSLLGKFDSVSSQFDQENRTQQQIQQQNIQRYQQRVEQLKMQRTGLQQQLDNRLLRERQTLTNRMQQRQQQIDNEQDADKKKELQKMQDQDAQSLKQVNQEIRKTQGDIIELTNQINAQQGLIDRLKA